MKQGPAYSYFKNVQQGVWTLYNGWKPDSYGLTISGNGARYQVRLLRNHHFCPPETIGKRITDHCEKRGLIVRPMGHLNVISPPLILTRDQIDELVDILGASIRATADDLVREGLWS